MADQPDASCLCGHPESQHRARYINGRFIDPCLSCECSMFGAVEEQVGELSTLLYAWDAQLCTSCEWRTSSDVKACLQCGARLQPVRVEVRSRDSP